MDRPGRKRVVSVVSSFPALSETFVVSRVLGLLERGWDVHVVCGESKAAEWARFPELHQRGDLRRRVHVVWPHRPRWLALLLIPAALARCLIKSLRGTLRYLHWGSRQLGVEILRRLYLDAELLALKPALIHFEFGSLARDRMHLRELMGCKVVASFRGYDLNQIGLDDGRYYEEVWFKADALHFLGLDLRHRAQRRGCPADRFHRLIPPAIDTQFFNPRERAHVAVTGTGKRPLLILSVGRLEWKKGYEYALQAIRLLHERGVSAKYRIVGEGAGQQAVAFARHDLGLEDRVELLGGRTRNEVREQMAWADVFLHAAVSEGFCNAVLEAQAMMLPVVCSDAGGLSENVAHGETGFVVPRRDPGALAEKLAVLAADPPLRERMARAGRERVLTRFQLPRQISAFEELYHTVLAGEGQPVRGTVCQAGLETPVSVVERR